MKLLSTKLNCFALAVFFTVILLTIKLLSHIFFSSRGVSTNHFFNSFLKTKSASPKNIVSIELGISHLLPVISSIIIFYLLLLLIRLFVFEKVQQKK